MLWRRALQSVETLFTAGWSVSEVAYAMRHPRRLLADPFRDAVREDIAEHGLYKTFPKEARPLKLRSDGYLIGSNPYVRVGPGGTDPIVARLSRHREPRARRLLIVCHCYGLPMPRVMETIFGLRGLEGYDVVVNIMNHHYLGGFSFWPGFGLLSPQMSRVIESVRSAVTGLRCLIKSLVDIFGYEEVALLGYSIGGHISLHVANHHPVDKLIAYCPVTSLRQTATELGLMSFAEGGVTRALRGLQGEAFDFADLDCLDPLQYDLRLSPEQLLIVLQTLDMMVPTHQSQRLMDRYPQSRCVEFPGTHTFPVEQQAMIRLLREFLA